MDYWQKDHSSSGHYKTILSHISDVCPSPPGKSQDLAQLSCLTVRDSFLNWNALKHKRGNQGKLGDLLKRLTANTAFFWGGTAVESAWKVTTRGGLNYLACFSCPPATPSTNELLWDIDHTAVPRRIIRQIYFLTIILFVFLNEMCGDQLPIPKRIT